ncbi:hypothetical protein L228DRAFT_257559 [Xylona heveae TC161]|uniref:Uncharacterized protein n=1 Tax=Xylona heveae (strain CBS 132557 / TC161) TaxID=1328760 RepID=A0A165JCS2_XYLHT|nr:hypothetical protein L228DRAFT_257559 [Xylona heveae TC161]KZF26063.1 hypothetical protein L228DRAFT_257559 [Xylona heveae TC161]
MATSIRSSIHSSARSAAAASRGAPFLDFLYPSTIHTLRRQRTRTFTSLSHLNVSSSLSFSSSSSSSHSASTPPEPGSLPRIAQPSIWTSLIPSFLRRRRHDQPGTSTVGRHATAASQKKEWNPATFYIVIFLLIGSQAIQMIALRREYATITRRSEARIGLLREVIERVQKGEEVDVEGLLGTGDKVKEREWEEVLKEIEQEDALWRSRANKADAEEEVEGKEAAAEKRQAAVRGDAAQEQQQAQPVVGEQEAKAIGSAAQAKKGRREYF